MNLKGASLAAPKDSYISHRAWKAIVKTARPPLSLTTDTHTYSLTPPIPTTPHPQTWKKKTVRHHKRIPVNTESADHWTSRLWDGSGLAFFFFKNNKWLKCKNVKIFPHCVADWTSGLLSLYASKILSSWKSCDAPITIRNKLRHLFHCERLLSFHYKKKSSNFSALRFPVSCFIEQLTATRLAAGGLPHTLTVRGNRAAMMRTLLGSGQLQRLFSR